MLVRILVGIAIGAGLGALLGYFGKCSSGACPLTANPYRGALYGAVMGAAFALTFSSKPKTQPQKASPPSSATTPMKRSEKELLLHIKSESDFKARVLDAKGVYLVDLFSNRCPPCRALAPTIVSLAKEYAGKVTVCKVDVERVPGVARQYRVQAVPTVLVFSDGKVVKRFVGLRAESKYAAVLDKLLKGPKH